MKNIQKTIGYILLFPPVLSVLLFTINLLVKDSGNIIRMYNLSSEWSGSYGENGGYMSATPVYFGLMAIAGAYLLSNAKEE
ncbi:MAG: hypothetical protein QM535_02820 [Limnohabitans sp.]|nr:hypothetical protein [Limnohabitans sp.]